LSDVDQASVLVIGALPAVVDRILEMLRHDGYAAWGQRFGQDHEDALRSGEYDAVLFGPAIRGVMLERYCDIVAAANPDAAVVTRSWPLAEIPEALRVALHQQRAGHG
jgi:hypothetical protein